MNYRKLAVAIAFCGGVYFLPGNIFSDNIDKANKYYEKYDYKYAIELYEKIMAKKPVLEVAQKLANCYRFINDTKKSEIAYSKVLSFKGFDPINYIHYADALKQNGKFNQAKENYLLYAEAVPAKSDYGIKMANGCDAARVWMENPDRTIRVNNMDAANSEYSDFSSAAVGDNLVFVSDRWFVENNDGKRKDVIYGWTGNPYLKLYQIALKGDQKVMPLPKPVNGMYHNGSATFNAKGDTVYYTRVDLPQSRKKEHLEVIKKGVFMSVKKGDVWSEPVRVFGNGANYSVQHPALSPDGSIIYFASDMPGGLGGMDIYAVRKNADGTWGQPKNCGSNINTPQADVFPYVREDGKFYYSSTGNIGIGGMDIFTSKGAYDTFTPPENLKAPINSEKDDFAILFTNKTDGVFSSNREGGKGLDDIYAFRAITDPLAGTGAKKDVFTADLTNGTQPVNNTLTSKGQQALVFAVDGKVIEKNTGLAMDNIRILLLNKTTGQTQSAISDLKGAFRFDLEPNTDYVVSGDKTRYYLQQEGNISTKGLKESTIFTINFQLERSKDAYLVRLNNIYYNFDKWEIRKDAVPELNKVVNFMNSMPNVNIQLRSHTDARGPAVYNQYLSQKRAESAVSYLKSRGVSDGRMTALGLGESQLLNRCQDGVACSKKEHQMNRRTEFKVVKVEPVLSMASNIMMAAASRKK